MTTFPEGTLLPLAKSPSSCLPQLAKSLVLAHIQQSESPQPAHQGSL